jgi:hypothetical protein
MATTTPNYDWPIPEDTDLVKDGAKAIRDLGNAIDTSAENFGGGLIHINTTTFSGVASQTVNGVFTSAYKNYLVTSQFSKTTASNNMLLRYTISGTPTATAYDRSGLFGNTSGTTGSFFHAVNQDAIVVGNTGDSNAFQLQTFSPQVSGKTLHIGYGSTENQSVFFAGQQSGNNSFDGFSLVSSTGNITGSITVFAYKD